MRFVEVHLPVAADRWDPLAAFYGALLAATPSAVGRVTAGVGETRLAFSPADGEPFFHVALLVPGDRFTAAAGWLDAHVAALVDPDDGRRHFDFAGWDARAVYFHDPAGNIMELIAHRGLADNGRHGPFSADELAGVSEVGIVCDPVTLAPAIATLGHAVWDGDVTRPGGLAFAGEKGRTLILARPGRGWMPTGRPAEEAPMWLTVTGGRPGQVALPAGGWLRQI